MKTKFKINGKKVKAPIENTNIEISPNTLESDLVELKESAKDLIKTIVNYITQ